MKQHRTLWFWCIWLILGYSGPGRAASPRVEIIADSAQVKVESRTISVVKKGQTFRLLKSEGAWVAIQIDVDEKPTRGWVLASAVQRLADPDVNEDTEAPAEPLDVRLAVDLTQVSGWGQQSVLYFKLTIANETTEPIDFKPAELELKADDQVVPQVVPNQQMNFGYPVFTDASMRAQVQQGAIPLLKERTLAPGAMMEGWMGFNAGPLLQANFAPGAIGGKTWVLDGKIGPHPIRFDLKAADVALISEKPRPSKLDPSVQVIEIGSRINSINASKVLDLLRTIPASDCGCVLVLKNQNCLFDNMATQQFQQQVFQIFQNNNQPVVSNEGLETHQHFYGYQGFFSYGQFQMVTSEAAGVMTILGRRPDTGAKLIKHLSDANYETRAAAAKGLTQHLAEENVVLSLTKASGDAAPAVRAAAVAALNGGAGPAQPGLRQNGSPDTVAVVKAMTDPEASVRLAAAQAANVFSCDNVRTALLPLLDDADFSVKLMAAASLGSLKARNAIPKLKELQADPNQQFKTAVIDALVNIGELTRLEGAMAKLDGGTLQDADFSAIGQAKEKDAVERLIGMLKGENYYQINFVGRTLGEIGDARAVDPLIQTFVYGNRNYGMVELPRALGKLGDNRAVEPLRQSLSVPNQNMQYDLRAAIYEGLLLLKAPRIIEDVQAELKKMEAANQMFQATPILQGLGRSRNPKATAVIEPYLVNQQTCMAAAEALWQLGTKESIALLEKKLSAEDFQPAQMIIMNRQWARTPMTVSFLKRIAEGKNESARMAATNALSNLQAPTSTQPAFSMPSPIGYFAPSTEVSNSVEAWVNDTGHEEHRGKVCVISLPGTTGASPDLLVEGNQWLEKYEKQGLIVMALWKSAGWDWDNAQKSLVMKSEVMSQQELRAVTSLARERGIKYRVGILAADSGLSDRFGGPAAERVALVDRAGVLQGVWSVNRVKSNLEKFEALIAELLAEPVPSPAATRLPRQIPPPQEATVGSRTASTAYAASSFDPRGSAWTLPAHNDTIWSVKFSPDGRTIATSGGDGIARIWDIVTGKRLHSFEGHEGNVRHCAYSADGTRLLTAGFDHTLRVWNIESGDSEKTLKDDSAVYFLTPLDDGQTVIAASQDSRIRAWNIDEGKIKSYLTGHSSSAWTASATSVNQVTTVISGSTDRTVRIWDLKTGETRWTLNGHTNGVNAVAISSDAKIVASGSDELILWDAATGTEKHRISVPNSFVYDLKFSPDQKIVAVGRSNHTVCLYDVATGKLLRQWNRGGWCVDISKDGKWIASGGDDRTMRVWKIEPAQ